jgi:hypothetical protein
MLALLLGVLLLGQLPTVWQTAGVVLVQGIFVGTLMMLMLKFRRRQTELHRIHGLPKSFIQTAAEHADSPQSDRSQSLGKVGGVIGAIIGSNAWLIVLSIRLEAWWLSALVVLLAGLLLLRWTSVFASCPNMTRSRHLKHIQVLCCELGAMQVALLLLMWATGSFVQTEGKIEGYPFWFMVALITGLCTALSFSMGYAAENARRREQVDA